MYLGLYVDTINVELDLTTSKDGKDTLSVDFAKGFQLGPQLGMEQTVNASRGSKLTITLKQVMKPADQTDGGNTDNKKTTADAGKKTGVVGHDVTTFSGKFPSIVVAPAELRSVPGFELGTGR
ncbi:hypothetical protein [Caballeronia fortuita]|nr:hypothetical protein [Caballeronia fortuita]